MKMTNKGFIQIPILVAITVSILVFGGIGYFSLTQYQNSQKQFLFDQKKKCIEAGKRVHKEKLVLWEDTKLFEPEYIYNKKLNTCIYYGGFDIKEPNMATENLFDTYRVENLWIIDSLTNKLLVSYWAIDGKPTNRNECSQESSCVLTRKEFDMKKDILMEEE